MDYIRPGQSNDKLIREGDTVVIYISEHQKYIIKIQSESKLQTKFGILKSIDLRGHPYGVRYECKKGWILPLRLTPELWTQLLPHRTQILYQADISMILLQLDIRPGSIVAESGTGSGSLSHALLRACRPSGFLYTFDINETRVNQALSEFKDHGFKDNVTVTQRNICESGFGEELIGKVDACILDLPRTWDAIEHAYRIMKPDGSRICTFSPCIEQVQQNVAKMTELKMKDIVTIETLLRPFEVKTNNLRIWDGHVLDGLVAVDRKRYENLKNSLSSTKRAKIDHDLNQSVDPVSQENCDDITSEQSPLSRALADPKANFNPQMLPRSAQLYARQFKETVSHSGYLSFASKRP